MPNKQPKDDLDRFYTNSNIVDDILRQIDLTKYKLVIEPSAGNGSFSLRIKDCLAFDISPAHNSIIQQDFLKWKYNGSVNRQDILCLGNPPFGKQGRLAIAFINKCCEISDAKYELTPILNQIIAVQKNNG